MSAMGAQAAVQEKVDVSEIVTMTEGDIIKNFGLVQTQISTVKKNNWKAALYRLWSGSTRMKRSSRQSSAKL